MKKKVPLKPTIIILDNVKDRCLREEAALDKVIRNKGIHAFGASNYGEGYISRSGIPIEKLPCIQMDTNYYFPPSPNMELTYEKLDRFMDIMLANGSLKLTAVIAAESDES